eukprot:Nk52_evm29s1671 gene=Nk52_evmTU29s1671
MLKTFFFVFCLVAFAVLLTSATNTGTDFPGFNYPDVPNCGENQRVVVSSKSGWGTLSCADGADYGSPPKGTQADEGHTNGSHECTFHPLVPQIVGLLITEHFITKGGWDHDYADRTGHDSRANAYAKSFPINQDNTPEDCTVRGYVKDNQWVPVSNSDTRYPNIGVTRQQLGNLIGPAEWPKPSTQALGQDPDICKGEPCCITQNTAYPSTSTFGGFADLSHSLHYMCQPVYYPTGDIHSTSSSACDRGGYYGETLELKAFNEIPKSISDSQKTAFQCLAINASQSAADTYGGLGLDCGPIMPGGEHYEKGWDLYKMHSWAVNQYYLASKKLTGHGICGNYHQQRVRHAALCHPSSTEKCETPYQDNMFVNYGRYNNGNPTLFNWGGRW